MPKPVIFHIDVNSAFLSWESVRRLSQGETTDLREIASVIGGSEENRHGIVLAKSPLAKSYGIVTGEPLMRARQKCPNLVVASPDYNFFVKCSRDFMELLRKYAPVVEQYSIDEAFCDMTGTEHLYGSLPDFAIKIKDEICASLGFTVNIGVSSNRLLAKMASDFKKPNLVHTLFPEEVPEKLWPLPVDDLFFVGRSTAAKLHGFGIHTIGDLAHTDVEILKYHFKKHGEVIHDYANGRDVNMTLDHSVDNKSYGNSITLKADVTDTETVNRILLSLCETVGARIRADKAYISVVSVNITDCEFNHYSRQTTLSCATNVTETIYDTAKILFKECFSGTPIRLLGVSTGKATNEFFEQYDLFDQQKNERLSKLNSAIDQIRSRYGEDSVKRACFVDSEEEHMTGGMNKAKRKKE
ncbi:MAG: hypothetical protein PUF12_03295 [Thermoflexaceae bacterium]|nr:hypothetical protein [Thermoflexaceae bacterium]